MANRFSFTNQPANPDFARYAVGDTSGSKQITITNNTDYPADPNVHLGGRTRATSTSPTPASSSV